MKLYYYTNKNVMFDYLSRNTIASDSIIKDIKGYRTIGTRNEEFLFITHLRLNRNSRERGIFEPEFVYPITIEISDICNDDGKTLFIKRTLNGYEIEEGLLKDYSSDIHIGALLYGEIPFSRVEKIYFDSQDDMDMFSRPSPDYWYPSDKFALLPKGFTEELSIDELELSEYENENLLVEAKIREKYRAAIINFFNATKNWKYGKYKYNIDKSMQELLNVDDVVLKEALPHYEREKRNTFQESCVFFGENNKIDSSVNQIIFDIISDILLGEQFDSKKQIAKIVNILNSIQERILDICNNDQERKVITSIIKDISDLILDNSTKGPEEIGTTIPGSIDMLKALLYVVKNPNNYDLFLSSLDAYHLDSITKRRAMVCWGFLNGLYGMPGEGFNKDNSELWQFIEAFVYIKHKDEVTLSVKKPDILIKDGRILGIELIEERIISPEEARSIILSIPKEKLNVAFYDKLLSAAEVEFGSRKKAANKGYAHSVATVCIPEIKKGDELNVNTRKILEQLVKDCKKLIPNQEKLYADYIEKSEKFEFVFNLDQQYWKKSIERIMEKNNA